MISHVWSVFCSHAIVDELTNNVSLINVIERLQLDPGDDAVFPLFIPIECSFVTLWARLELDTPSRGIARFSLIGPNKEELGQWKSQIDLTAHPRLRNRAQFNSLRIGGAGIHFWIVECATLEAPDTWAEVARLPLQITLLRDEADEEED